MKSWDGDGIAFDLDGVLINSTPVHSWAFQEVFRSLGITHFDYARWAGMSTMETIDKVLLECGVECSETKRISLSERKSALARERMSQESVIVQGCPQLLEQLSSQFPLALASSASPGSVDLFLDQSRSRPYFSAILNRSSVVRSKPAPDIYELAARRLDVTPARMLVIEDAVSGVQAGKLAGCEVWAVLGTSNPDDLKSAGASRVHESLADVGRAILRE